ncbi:MAG: methylated-DNA--protein-cysteine methyltransferase [Actinomycetota bacterium]|jgi:methylated-DNA-[protein]-cysteine S-methyltransferase
MTEDPTTPITAETATAPSSGPSAVSIPSPIGRLDLIAVDGALVEIRFGEGAPQPETVPVGTCPVLDRAATQLGEYFAGTRTEFDLPLAPAGTTFQSEVWGVLRQIPYGETITYGEQAGRLGDRNKSRAVGAANGKNPIPIVVPCHRVVGANGHLTGFAGGLDLKAWLLDHERRNSVTGGVDRTGHVR